MAPAAEAADGGDGKVGDLYGVLGVEKECSAQELRSAYKRLGMRWHPDRCLGNARSVEEAKKKFQDIQEAYSVLSDSNKRFLYDVGVYQNDDDEEDMQDMGDFLSEMAEMMSQTKPCENEEENFEQLQELFDDIFRYNNSSSNTSPVNFNSSSSSSPSSVYSSSFSYNGGNPNQTHKQQSAGYANDGSSTFDAQEGPHQPHPPNPERIERRNSRSTKH